MKFIYWLMRLFDESHGDYLPLTKEQREMFVVEERRR